MLCLCALGVQGAGPYDRHTVEVELRAAAGVVQDSAMSAPPSRALAAALAITLGPFGGHRILLGTSPVIPVVYGLTFGGFGLLVLIDLGHILFTHDLREYMDDRHVLMWAGRGGNGTTRP